LNWSPEGVPGLGDTVRIPGGAIPQPVLSQSVSIAGLLIEPTAVVQIHAFDLSVSGSVSGGTVVGSGRVILTGTDATAMGEFPDLRVTGRVALAGATAADDLVVVGNAPSRLALSGQALTVRGDLSLISAGLIEMTNLGDVLVVEGDASFSGRDSEVSLTAGTMFVAGNFYGDGADRFVASGGHKVVLNGIDQLQFVDHFSSSASGSRYNDLEIWNPMGVSFTRATYVDGDISIAGGADLGSVSAAGVGIRVTLTGSLSDPSFRWSVAKTTFAGSGDLALPAQISSEVTVSGNRSLVVFTRVVGDLIVTGNVPARLALNANTLIVDGSLSVVSNGLLEMTEVDDVLDVDGDVLFDGRSSVGFLTAGTMLVGGDFLGNGGQKFVASDSHVVVLDGDTPQIVDHFSSTADESRYNDLEIDNPSEIHFARRVYIGGELRSPQSADTVLSGSGVVLTVGSVAVDTLVFDNLQMRVIGDIEEFDYVTFDNMSPSVVQLDISHPGATLPFELKNVTFMTTPTSGDYVRATDSAADGVQLVVKMICSNPPDGTDFEQEAGGARIDWLECTDPTRTPTPPAPTPTATFTPTPTPLP
jgi:hypothetical protein